MTTLFQYARSKAIRGSAALLATVCCLAVPERAEAELVTALLQNTTTGLQGVARFDSSTPSLFSSPFVAISGTVEGFLGIDFRPTTQQLFGLGSLGGLYVINPLTGVASLQANLSAFPGNGTFFGIDFNPVADLAGAASLRLVNEADQNFAVNANTGAATAQTAITPGTANLTGSAYTNNDINPATGTTLLGLDAVSDTLLSTANPVGGVYTTVGSLGVNANDAFRVSFDVSGTGIAYAAFTPTGSANANLYTINTTTGAAASLGTIGPGGGLFLTQGIALLPDITPASVPEPSSMILLGLCGAGAFGYRLRRKTTTAA